MALVVVSERYPSLHDRIVLAHTTKTLDLRKVILIDSQTTHNVFCNDKYLENICRAKKVLHLRTHGGRMSISKEDDVKGLYLVGKDATVYYENAAITNILSFKKMAKLYWIT